MGFTGETRQFLNYGAGIAAAALACLQPGIDPVFLTLLTSAHDVDPAGHGWIVGATQCGMALGSLAVMRMGPQASPRLFPAAAIGALAASLGTARAGNTDLLLALRGCYGFAMGLIYTQAMSGAARLRPHHAYAAVFLLQLILSTLVALILPAIAMASSPATALLTHAMVPLLTLAAILGSAGTGAQEAGGADHMVDEHSPSPDSAAWAFAAASLSFICATMMIWSFTGALAVAAHFSETMLGRAVALGSVAGAATALLVMRGRPIIPIALTGLLSGLCLLAPMVAIPTGQDSALLLSVIALNVGSTAIIIRCSGLAAERSRDRHFQRAVAFTHSGGMILGPVMGSLLTQAFGMAGLEGGMLIVLTTACIILIFAATQQGNKATPDSCSAAR